jgi:hypothetical protein
MELTMIGESNDSILYDYELSGDVKTPVGAFKSISPVACEDESKDQTSPQHGNKTGRRPVSPSLRYKLALFDNKATSCSVPRPNSNTNSEHDLYSDEGFHVGTKNKVERERRPVSHSLRSKLALFELPEASNSAGFSVPSPMPEDQQHDTDSMEGKEITWDASASVERCLESEPECVSERGDEDMENNLLLPGYGYYGVDRRSSGQSLISEHSKEAFATLSALLADFDEEEFMSGEDGDDEQMSDDGDFKLQSGNKRNDVEVHGREHSQSGGGLKHVDEVEEDEFTDVTDVDEEESEEDTEDVKNGEHLEHEGDKNGDLEQEDDENEWHLEPEDDQLSLDGECMDINHVSSFDSVRFR